MFIKPQKEVGNICMSLRVVIRSTHPTRPQGKGKVAPVLFFLTEHYAMKAYWGVEVKLHIFFDISTRWR